MGALERYTHTHTHTHIGITPQEMIMHSMQQDERTEVSVVPWVSSWDHDQL